MKYEDTSDPEPDASEAPQQAVEEDLASAPQVKLGSPAQLKRDVKLPNHYMRQIQLEGQAPFVGRWLGQYFDRPAAKRYSIGETPGSTFFVICLDDSNRSLNLEWFQDAQAVHQSNLHEELKRAADQSNLHEQLKRAAKPKPASAPKPAPRPAID